MLRITAICMSAGYSQSNDLTHIEQVRWVQDGTGREDWTYRSQMVDWIDNHGVRAYVLHNYRRTEVVTVGTGRNKYLRTVPNATTRDNLLSLPRYSNAA